MVAGVDYPLSSTALTEVSSSAGPLHQANQGTVLSSSQLAVGKQLQAEVVAKLADGTYIVKVADIAARMQLPNSPEVGAKLTLTLLSTSPRATFLLNSEPGSATSTNTAPMTSSATLANSVKQLIDDFNHSASSAGLALQNGSNVGALDGKASDPRLINLAQTQVDSAPATLSTTGRLLNELLQNIGQQSSIVNVSKLPLLNNPDAGASVLAKALQSGVSSSGVFYESHLLQWAEGTLSTAQLMQEPQASYPPPSTIIASAQHSATSDTLLANLPKDATSMIQQQLQTLEQQRFLWSGEIWPGQTMDWEITKENDSQQQNQPEKSWNSTVKFELPQLGNVSAQLQLTGNRLKLIVQTKDAGSALLMQNHAHELVSALDISGTRVDALHIKTNPAKIP